jgi:chromosome segregation ATPase
VKKSQLSKRRNVMSWKFWSKTASKKIEQAGDALNKAIVQLDPETATEAQIELMEEKVDELAREAAKARVEYEREEREAQAARTNYNRMLEAAQLLQSKVDAGDDSVTDSLASLMEQLETLQPEVQLEIDEATHAKATLEAFETALKDATTNLKQARSNLKRAASEMKRANAKKQAAEAEEERNKRLAGISTRGDNMQVALDAMRECTTELEAEAEAAKLKADLIKPFDAKSDDNIAAALAEVDGAPAPADTKSRLAGLQAF